MSARAYLLLLIAAAVAPVWLFSAVLLSRYWSDARDRYDREAVQTARQVGFVVEGELDKMLVVLRSLSMSNEMALGRYDALYAEAVRLISGSRRIILLRDYGTGQRFNTAFPYGAELPPAVPLTPDEAEALRAGRPVVSRVYHSPASGEVRIAVGLPVTGPGGEPLVLGLTLPTEEIHQVLKAAVPAGWTVGVGDRDSAYVARSELHDEVTGKPGLPEYIAKTQGESGAFTSVNFQDVVMLAGYYRAPGTHWLYAANVPLDVAMRPLRRSVLAIAGIALAALALSLLLAWRIGAVFTARTGRLVAAASEIGRDTTITALPTGVKEFEEIGEALIRAQQDLRRRKQELGAVLDTAPAGVWFTFDPEVRRVTRNRFAADLLAIDEADTTGFATPDAAALSGIRLLKDGRVVAPADMPLQRAFRGEGIDGEEYVFAFPDGRECTLLTNAQAIRDHAGAIIGAVSVSLDISERKRLESQRGLLVQELTHRVKNTLAIVQSLILQTLRTAPSLAAAGETLSARIQALGKAQEILTRQNSVSAELRDCVAEALAAQIPEDRVTIEGADVTLSPSSAFSVTLLMHELATNAVKHGALTGDGGRVRVSWTVSDVGDGPMVEMDWKESGGPPIERPSTSGFGSKLIRRLVASEGGTLAMTFEPDGLECRFSFRAARYAAPPRVLELSA